MTEPFVEESSNNLAAVLNALSAPDSSHGYELKGHLDVKTEVPPMSSALRLEYLSLEVPFMVTFGDTRTYTFRAYNPDVRIQLKTPSKTPWKPYAANKSRMAAACAEGTVNDMPAKVILSKLLFTV